MYQNILFLASSRAVDTHSHRVPDRTSFESSQYNIHPFVVQYSHAVLSLFIITHLKNGIELTSLSARASTRSVGSPMTLIFGIDGDTGCSFRLATVLTRASS